MTQTDCNFELQNSRKAPLRRKEAGVDPESGLPIVFAPRLIRNPKTDEQAIVASVAEEARWARKWRVPVKTVRMALERAIPAELVGHQRNDSNERLRVADTARSAINDFSPPTASDFHALEAKGDVRLLRAELPDGSHRFSLTGIDSRVLEQSHTLAVRAGRGYLDSTDDPSTDWAKEIWHFHVRRLEASWIQDRRDRFTTSAQVYDGVPVRCPSESLDGFCAVSADFVGSLATPTATSPVAAGKRVGASPRRGKQLMVGPFEKVKQKIRELKEAGLKHQRRICERLGGSLRPPNAAWRELTWLEAYDNKSYHGSVKSWLSRIQ
jgi:hypothetical protein